MCPHDPKRSGDGSTLQAPARPSGLPASPSGSAQPAVPAASPSVPVTSAPSPASAPASDASAASEEFARPAIGDPVLYTLDGGDVYPAIVLKVHTDHDVDIHIFGRERHGMAFERCFIERGAIGDVGKWAPKP